MYSDWLLSDQIQCKHYYEFDVMNVNIKSKVISSWFSTVKDVCKQC